MQDGLTWTSAAMERQRSIGRFWLVCAVGLMGCTGSRNLEILEARLREHERTIQEYEQEIVAVNSRLSIAQRETRILREQFAEAGKPTPAQEATEAIAAAEGLRFHALLTAGQDKDGVPGDELFHAIVYPHDSDGELVKVIGELQVEAIDLSLPPEDRTVGQWTFSAEEVGELWHGGYLASGYRLELPFKQSPAGSKIILSVKLKTPDGRELAANHAFAIDPQKIGETALASEGSDASTSESSGTEADGEGGLQTADSSPAGFAVKPVSTEQLPDDAKPRPFPQDLERPRPLFDGFSGALPLATEAASPAPASETVRTDKPVSGSESVREPLDLPMDQGLNTSDSWSKYSQPLIR